MVKRCIGYLFSKTLTINLKVKAKGEILTSVSLFNRVFRASLLIVLSRLGCRVAR